MNRIAMGLALLGHSASAALTAEPATNTVTPPPEDCSAPGVCRQVGKVEVHERGKPMTFNINQTLPWTPQGNLMLFAGETAVVKLVQAPEPGRLIPALVQGGPQSASRALQPGEIRFTLKEGPGGGMMMTVESRHDKPLRYMLVMVTTDGKPSKTTVCTLLPNITAFEAWPHPIVQIAATNFYVHEQGAVCE